MVRFLTIFYIVNNLWITCTKHALRPHRRGAFILSKYRQKRGVCMWVEYNPNPAQSRAGDCAIRAVAKALDIDWETAYAKIALNGFVMGDVISSNAVWGSVLRQNGFTREIVPNTCPDCYTLREFAEDHPKGTFVVALPNHVATVVSGNIFDSWDSSSLTPLYYWRRE